MSNVKCKSHKKRQASRKPQPVYEYFLPRDAKRLKKEALISATYVFLQDFLASRHLYLVEIEKHADEACERTKQTTVGKSLTNDFNLFVELSKKYYIEYYLGLQNFYSSHLYELEIAKQKAQELGPSYFLDAIASIVEAGFQEEVVA